jgi:hypothetical protein
MNAVDYIVTRNFTDKTNNNTYKVGDAYNAENAQRVQELENGGYIAAASSTFAKDAKAQAENTQANAKANAQAQKNVESAKTVVNGKVVPLKFAQAAESAFDESNRQSGVQAHHDNSSESVPAGQVASRSQSTAESAEVQAQVKKANVQSGQKELEKHMNQAQQQSNNMQQQAEQQALAAAAEKTNPMAAEHETAAEMQQAANEVKAKGTRAKKE